MSLAAKISAVGSALLAIGTFVSFLILIFSGAGWGLGGILFTFMGLAAVLGILFSLLMSYIIMERYEDEEPMQWTIWAGWVFVGLVSIFFFALGLAAG